MFALIRRLYAVQLVRFGTVGAAVTGCFMGLNALFARGFGWPAQLAFVVAYPPALGVHFILNKLWTFGDRRPTSRRHVREYLFAAGVTFMIQWPAFTVLQRFAHAPGWLAAGGANVLQVAFSFLLLRRRVFSHAAGAVESAPSETATNPASMGRGRVGWAIAGALLLTVAFDVWTVSGNPGSFAFLTPKQDYYNLLIQGFQRGHLYLNASPDAALLALPESARPGDAPYLLDASLYRGHYYLYFGPTPAVLLYWPYAALTGHGLPQALGSLIFALVGTGFAALLFLELRRRWFPRAGAVWTGMAILAIGLGSSVPSTLRHPLFYETATAAGFAFTMAALWCLTVARRSGRRSGWWLLGAGLAVGLAAGARVNLTIAGVLVLVLGCAAVAQTAPPGGRRRRLAIGLAWAAVGAGSIGAGLAAYNVERFGHPFEFGHTYQLGVNPQRMFQAANLWHNAGLYYLSPPELNAYFPYVAPRGEPPKPPDYVGREHAHGEWIWLPLVILGGGAALWCMRRQSTAERQELGWSLGLPGLTFAVNFIVTGSAGVRANRYMLDFHPALVVTVVAALGLVGGARPWVARMWAVVTGVGLAAVVLFNALASLQVHGFFASIDPMDYDRMAGVSDRIVWPLLSFGTPVGDREVTLRWPRASPTEGREPLLVTGSPDFDDWLWLEYRADHQVRFDYDSAERGSAIGEWFSFRPGSTSSIRISGGPLLPRPGHPWYGQRSDELMRALKRRLTVTVDGRRRFERDVPSHDSSPRLQRWGVRRTSDGQTKRFSGSIAQVAALPLDEGPAREALAGRGPIQLQIGLPEDRYGWVEPLLEFGFGAHFDLIAVRYLRPGYIQFIHDQAGGGASQSPEIAVDYGVQHRIEFEAPQATAGLEWREDGPVPRPNRLRTIRVSLDGVPVFSSRNPANLDVSPAAVLGANLARSSVSRELFAGAFSVESRLSGLGKVGVGTLTLPGATMEAFSGRRGLLLQLTSASGDRVNLVWRRSTDGALEFGWNKLNGTVWSDPVAPSGGSGLRIVIQPRAPAAYDVAIWFGSRQKLAVSTDLLADEPVQAEAIRSREWSGSALAEGPTESPAELVQGTGASDLPGVVRIIFGLPDHPLVASSPLLSAGRTGAADSVYLRQLPNGRFVLGIDHWLFAVAESAPFDLAADRVHAAVIELGSLMDQNSAARNYARLSVDGRVVLSRALPLYPVLPSEVAFGANPLGMSTSSARFEGTILAVRRHLAPVSQSSPRDPRE